MVKNFNDLNEKEIGALRGEYTKYFMKILAPMKYEFIPEFVKKAATYKVKLDAEYYSDEMVSKLEKGKRIGYVFIEGEIKAFITGRVYEDEAWISHLYTEDMLSEYIKKRAVLELFNSIVLDFKNLGKDKVRTEAGYYEEDLMDILESLGFEVEKTYIDGSTTYEKSIKY